MSTTITLPHIPDGVCLCRVCDEPMWDLDLCRDHWHTYQTQRRHLLRAARLAEQAYLDAMAELAACTPETLLDSAVTRKLRSLQDTD